jgi:riboflavin kinase/FMN adenylyltransferase
VKLIRGLQNLKPEHRGCVATIGNFDGVHLGHQRVLGQLAERAAELHLPNVVVVFEPQPGEYFAADKAAPRLTRFREKLEALSRYSVDRVLCLPFNAGLAALSADDFIQQVLVDGLGLRYLVVGDDFRFGHGRDGDFARLQAAGEMHGFDVVNMHTFAVDGERVSSTRIRASLVDGDLDGAARLLGRSYRISGRVVHGDKRGRTIGFPTANIFLHRPVSPLHGVFMVEMFGLDREPWPGVANLGNRPTVDGARTLLEVHLLGLDEAIYGRHVHVDFLQRLRPEQRFPSFEDLKNQILADVVQARSLFAQRYQQTK